jgi:hypothetical protein
MNPRIRDYAKPVGLPEKHLNPDTYVKSNDGHDEDRHG